MDLYQNRAAKLERVLSVWLTGHGRGELNDAMEKTISEGLFSRSDVEFAVNHLVSSVLNGELLKWCERVVENLQLQGIMGHFGNMGSSAAASSKPTDTRVFCLH